MGIEEREKIQIKGTKNILNKIIGENLRKVMPVNVQKANRTPNRQDSKKSSPHSMVKTLNVQNKDIESGKMERSSHKNRSKKNDN